MIQSQRSISKTNLIHSFKRPIVAIISSNKQTQKSLEAIHIALKNQN